MAPARLLLEIQLGNVELQTQIEELYLMPTRREEVSLARDLTAIIHARPGAGGPGEPASFSVWHKAGLNVAVPLLASAVRSGGNITQPLLQPGDVYRVLLAVYPDSPGIYEYEVSARCRRGPTTWRQMLDGRFRIVVIGPEDHRLFSGAVLLLWDRVDQVVPRVPDEGLRERARPDAWDGRPSLGGDEAFRVAGRSSARPFILR